MNRRSRTMFWLAALALVVMAAGCGGGGGDGGGGGGGGVAAGTFVKAVAPDLSTNTQFGPFNMSAYRRAMHLYRASDIKGAGYVKAVSFRLNGDLAAAVTCPNTTVRLGHTSKTQFDGIDNTFAGYVEEGKGSFVTMIDNTTVSIPTGSAGAYYALNFTTPFYYNGVDNLIVDVERTTVCSGEVGNKMETGVGYNGQLYSSSSPATGNASANYQQIKLTFAGGDDAITFGGASSNFWPFSQEMPRVQMLYLADEIDGSGPITGVGFKIQTLTTQASYTYTIKMAHTTKSALTTTFADNVDKGAPVTVANGTFTVPANVPAGSYIWISCNGSFSYNGTDNLIVDIDVSYGSGDTYFMVASTTAGRRAWGYHGDVAATGLSTTTYEAKLRFNGAPVTVLPPSTGTAVSSQVLGSGMAGQLQSLYPSTLLGTSGTINSLYVRLDSSTTVTTASLTNYKVYMGHTSKTQLNMAETYDSNMTENATVFSGTLTIPAGKKGGGLDQDPAGPRLLV